VRRAQGAGRRAPAEKGERGFALLLVFLMAAVVALFLYMQMPRVAFESERDKEQTLIDRGEQYKRAIQLYVIAVKKYPQKIEDLENTNNKRYLRQRYIDPMTGKDEWRMIHVNAAGILTDSLVQKPPTADGKTPPTGGPLASTVGTPTPDPNAAAAPGTATDPNDVNAAVRRRPSDLVGQAYTSPANGTVDPNDPKTWGPISLTPITPTGTANGQTAPTGMPPSGAVGFNGGLPGQPLPGQPGQPGQQLGGQPVGIPLPGQPGFNPLQMKVDANGQLVPVAPTQTGAVINSQTGGVQNTPQPGGINAPGMNPNGNGIPAQNLATQAINAQLMNPNPQAGVGGLGGQPGMQGGIAGVASNYKGPSIKIYGGRQKYQEWEFIFSLNDGRSGAPGQGRNPLQPGQNGLTPQTPGAPGTGAAPIGSTTGTAPTTPANPGN
jgi:hypothetical protein